MRDKSYTLPEAIRARKAANRKLHLRQLAEAEEKKVKQRAKARKAKAKRKKKLKEAKEDGDS